MATFVRQNIHPQRLVQSPFRDVKYVNSLVYREVGPECFADFTPRYQWPIKSKEEHQSGKVTFPFSYLLPIDENVSGSKCIRLQIGLVRTLLRIKSAGQQLGVLQDDGLVPGNQRHPRQTGKRARIDDKMGICREFIEQLAYECLDIFRLSARS